MKPLCLSTGVGVLVGIVIGAFSQIMYFMLPGVKMSSTEMIVSLARSCLLDMAVYGGIGLLVGIFLWIGDMVGKKYKRKAEADKLETKTERKKPGTKIEGAKLQWRG